MQTPLHIQVYTVEKCLGEKDDEMVYIVPRHIASEVWAQFHPYPWVWLASNSEILMTVIVELDTGCLLRGGTLIL